MDPFLFRLALWTALMSDLTPLQMGILVDLSLWGPDKAQNIADRVDTHRNTASGLLTDMKEKGYVSNKGGGVYELTDLGRTTGRELFMAGVNPYVDEDDEDDDENESTD